MAKLINKRPQSMKTLLDTSSQLVTQGCMVQHCTHKESIRKTGCYREKAHQLLQPHTSATAYKKHTFWKCKL